MARRPRSGPTRSQAAAAREAARRDSLPIRFIADYDYATVPTTTAYKKGMRLMPPAEHRKAALAAGKAVVDGD